MPKLAGRYAAVLRDRLQQIREGRGLQGAQQAATNQQAAADQAAQQAIEMSQAEANMQAQEAQTEAEVEADLQNYMAQADLDNQIREMQASGQLDSNAQKARFKRRRA